jgi:tetratricopeptide (TPR) repeat protein
VFHIISPRRIRFLGRGLWPDENQPRYAAVYDEALLDQIVRAQQLGRGNEALQLAKKLYELAPSADSAVLIRASYRIAGNQSAAQYFLGDLPLTMRSDPRFNLVIALFQRDRGDEQSARRFLEDAASKLPGTPAAAAVSKPMAQWPRSLAEMTEERVGTVAQ